MNNWRSIKEQVPKAGTYLIRVKYTYYKDYKDTSLPLPQNLMLSHFYASLSQYLGIGTVHIDPPMFDDNGEDLLSGGFRWSDLKGRFQTITHWMYVDEPYDESEENIDFKFR